MGILGETTTTQENKANCPQIDQRNSLGEAEKYYKNIIEQQKVTHSMLEADLGRAEKQIEILKKERKIFTIKEDLNALSKDILPEQPKTILPLNADNLKALANNEKLAHKDNGQEKLSILLQQRTQELQSERQMAETWIAELEVTSKAYDSEKRKNKQLLQQVTS